MGWFFFFLVNLGTACGPEMSPEGSLTLEGHSEERDAGQSQGGCLLESSNCDIAVSEL